ncbi:type II toxin-antitoxin system HipA family toxin [Pedobacter sp. L105]|uniref:type II toxin-antitoxin system HipA family toxin n=1 Tax=Pedobacter sp. L105 TaxID=1641871 RepID=UPI00131AD928|nr:HipA domain-containing protein [Pedobacter sp. L105]
MAADKTDIWVYAHWVGMELPKIIGILSAHHGKGRKTFSFEYSAEWIDSEEQFLLDPDIEWYSGIQFPNGKENFDVFIDSMPDTWGRTLMKRQAAQRAAERGTVSPNLYELNFLLGVNDEGRMGALRFKLDPEEPFLNNEPDHRTPPWTSIRELQHAAKMLENNSGSKDSEKWLNLLLSPGSSLGGARSKANILDHNGELWIAKFPSKNDTINKAAWEYLAYELALKTGIEMSECRIEKIHGPHDTFFTRRFDRKSKERIHFSSAMTMTGHNEDTIKEENVGYLDLAEFIQFRGAAIEKDLHQLWRRIIFNISISNTDDHLRNHGFLLSDKGWVLSPAFDINPSIDKNGLALNIDANNNALSYDLAKSVGEYFKLDDKQMDKIIEEVRSAVNSWEKVAKRIGIPRAERELMAGAFK